MQNLPKCGVILVILYLSYIYFLVPFIKATIETLVFHPPLHPNTHLYKDWDHFMIGPIDNKISVLYWQYPDAKLTVLYSHGTGDDLTIIGNYLKIISNEFKVNVIGYDYSGYGLSSGKMSEEALNNDIKIVYDHCINELKINSKSIIVWGQSLGTTVSIHLASRNANIGGIIIQSGFYSVLSLVLPDPFVWMLKRMDVFNNKDNLYKINMHCLLIHGTHDKTLSFQHAQNMADILEKSASSEKVNKIWLNMGHEWRYILSSQPEFRIAIQNLLESVLNDVN